MEPTIVDLNINALREFAFGKESDSAIRYRLRNMQELGLMKIYPKIPLSRSISIEQILNGTTGYLTVDRISNDIRDKSKNSVGEILGELNVRNMDRLFSLLCKINDAIDEGKQQDQFTLGLSKQFSFITLLIYHKENNVIPDLPISLDDMGKVITLEMQKREHYIKNYYFKLSNPEEDSIEHWPVRTGKIKKVDLNRGLGYISLENNPDLFFHLNEVSFEFKIDDRVEFNLPITARGANGPKAVFIRRIS